MKKLFKGLLSLGIVAAVGIPQINAATTPDYVIEVKSKKYSKQTTSGLYGLVYTEAYTGYGDDNWPLVECYTPFVEANDAFYATDETNTYKKFLIRQFGVSMGVVYWINPTQNVIHYWNTFTGEVGTDTPEKGLRGSKTPTKHKGLNYSCVDIPGQSDFAYPFSGAQTGIGSVTQDWYGNIVHQWNNVSDAGINTPVQGYAVYKSPTTYGQLIDFEPRLSDMTTQDYPYLRRSIVDDGDGVNDSGDKLEGSSASDHSQSNYYSTTSPNPNWVGDAINWVNNWYYHAWNSANSGSSKKVVDFMGASGNLYGNDGFVDSDFFWGDWGGQIFHVYDGYSFGNMFADGQYSNWFLNYNLHINSKPSIVTLTEDSYTVNGTTYSGYKPGEYGLSTYPREFVFRECDPLDYFYCLPVTGFVEYSSKLSYHFRFDYIYLQSPDGSNDKSNNLSMYTSSHPRYGYNMTYGYDAMNVPEIDSIKGHRVLIHNMWLQYWPENITTVKNSTTYNMRDGQIQIRSCPYSGGYNTTTGKWTGTPNGAYAQVGYGYGYNKSTNDYVNVLGTYFTATNTSVNCWSELERVNDNVLALYTNVPGKGFSKYYITAVEQDNPVTLVGDGVTQKMDANNNIVNTISFTPPEHDKGTLHRYQIYYRTKKSGESVYEKSEVIDGATQYPWTLAGVASYEGIYAGQTITFDHIAPYGGEDESSVANYDREYQYMIMPIYDASSHYGTETILATTPTSYAPVCPVEGTFEQVTAVNDNGETLYGFSVALKPTVDASVEGAASATKMIIVPQDDETKDALANNTGVTVSTGTASESSDAKTYTIYNTDDLSVTGYHVIVDNVTVSDEGELPSVTWHNIDPTKEYNVKVYIVATSESYFTPSEVLNTTLVVPELTWSTTPADFHKLIGDYGSLTGNEDMPMGSFRRIDPETDALDETPSNPVTLNNANYYGTRGSVFKPVYVTNEVLGSLNTSGEYENAGWRVAYGVYIYDEDGNNFQQMQLQDQLYSAAYAACYSNEADVVCDVIGLKVDFTEVEGEDGRTRKIYNPTQKTYKAKVEVAYRRISDDGVNIDMEIKKTTYTDLIIGSTTLPELGVKTATNSAVKGALYQRNGTHFYYESAENEGYYPYYYDAAMLFNWDEYTTLNRYMGYYGASTAMCYGHYETDEDGNRNPDEWVQYHAGTILTDGEVASLTNESGISALDGGAIGYNSTTDNWSALAIASNQVPMNIHYVHGSNTALNGADAIATVKFNVTLTAEYPIVNYAGINAGFMVAEDPATYDIPVENGTMNVMTVPTKLTDMYMSQSSITTGVKGILTNALGGVQLYPNPVGSVLTLRAPMVLGEVKIFAADGQLVKVVKEISDTMASINVADLPQGVYIVHTLGVAQIMIKK